MSETDIAHRCKSKKWMSRNMRRGRVAHFHRSRRKQIHVLSDGKKTSVPPLVRFLIPWNMLKVEQICDLCHRRGKSTWLHYCQGEEIDHGIRGGWKWWRPVFWCCRTDSKFWHFFLGEWHPVVRHFCCWKQLSKLKFLLTILKNTWWGLTGSFLPRPRHVKTEQQPKNELWHALPDITGCLGLPT